MSKFFVDYNRSSQATTILWTHEDIKIEETEPFIDFIRCDFNGEDYKFLYQDEKGLNKENLSFHNIEVYGEPTCCAVSYNNKKYDLIGNTTTQSVEMNVYKKT